MATYHSRYGPPIAPAGPGQRRRSADDESAAELGRLFVWVITPLVAIGAIVGGALLALPSLLD
jgi:hypothetical protein